MGDYIIQATLRAKITKELPLLIPKPLLTMPLSKRGL
jgi:hypothetical protein